MPFSPGGGATTRWGPLAREGRGNAGREKASERERKRVCVCFRKGALLGPNCSRAQGFKAIGAQKISFFIIIKKAMKKWSANLFRLMLSAARGAK